VRWSVRYGEVVRVIYSLRPCFGFSRYITFGMYFFKKPFFIDLNILIYIEVYIKRCASCFSSSEKFCKV
jgi:hypothetical protein